MVLEAHLGETFLHLVGAPFFRLLPTKFAVHPDAEHFSKHPPLGGRNGDAGWVEQPIRRNRVAGNQAREPAQFLLALTQRTLVGTSWPTERRVLSDRKIHHQPGMKITRIFAHRVEL